MRILPTATGGKGLLLLTLLLLAFFATGYSNPFFLVITFSVVLGCLGALLAWHNLRGVTLEALDMPLAAADAPRPLRVRLQTRRRAFDLGVEWNGTRIAHVALADDTVEATATLPPLPRGVQPLTRLRLSSRFPFGFVRVLRDCPSTQTLSTYPAPLPAAAPQHDARGHGEVAARSGRGSGIAGLRRFRTGDALGDVHWRATARAGAPIVKEREPEADPALVLVVDRRLAPDAFERSLARACQLVLGAREQGRPLRLCSQGTDLDSTRTGSDELLRWLAAAQPLPPAAPPPPAPTGAQQVLA